MRRRLALLSALLLALALAGCAPAAADDPDPAPSPTGTVQPARVPFSLPWYPGASLHPVESANRTNLTLMPLLYEGLFRLDPAFQPESVLCRNYTVSEDGLTWTFTLQSGVTFSDGTPLTARHAADSILAARASARYAARLSGVTGAQAAGELSLTVTLSAPNGALPTLLDVPVFLETEGGGCLGTGPYVLTRSGEGDALTAREGWWQGETVPEQTIPLTAMEQPEDLVHAFDTREVGLVTADLTGTGTAGFSTTYEVWDCDTTDFLYLLFNTRSGPCADLTVRLGLSRGVDRDSIATSLFARRVSGALLPVSPASPLYDGEVGAALEYSVDAMDQLLGRWEQSRPLTFLVNSENSFKVSAARFLADQWEGAGVEVRVEAVAWEEFTRRLAAGDFDLCLAETVLTPDFDLTPLLGTGGSLNYGGWSDARTDLLLSQLRAAGEEDRPAAARELYRHLTEQVPITPICFKHHSVLTQWQGVTGLTPTQSDAFYGLSWSVS